MNDQAKALLFVAALFAGCGFTGGRMTAPEPPVEVRVVRIPPRPQFVSAPVARAPEPAPAPVTAQLAPIVEPEAKPPLPVARPKVEPKPKERPQPKPRAIAPKHSSLPSCAAVKREYERMTWTEKMAAYHKASSEEIAHGRRCLGL